MAEISETVKKTDAPAFGVSFQVDLGGGMGIVFQTHLEREAALNGQLDGLLDRMYSAGERQKAKGELLALHKHVEQHHKLIADGDARVLHAEENHQKAVAEREAAIGAFLKLRAREEEAAREEHNASGRRGEFKPGGALKSRLSAHDASIQKAKDDIAKLEMERDKALKAEAHARQVALDEIEKTQVEIERRQALISPAG